MPNRKIKCTIVKTCNNHHVLICDEPFAEQDPVFYPEHGTWSRNRSDFGAPGYELKKLIAISVRGVSTVPFLPEYVIEAYDKGAREFEVEVYDSVITQEKLNYSNGLLIVTCIKPKRETYTREEVINMLYAISTLKTKSDIRQWLNNNYK